MGMMLKFRCILVYLKYWTLNVMSLMVYPKVLLHPMFSIKERMGKHGAVGAMGG